VLGTRPDAVQHALLVRQWSDDVVFFVHTQDVGVDDLRSLRARGIVVVDGTVARLLGESDRLTGVELVDGRVIPRAAVLWSDLAPRAKVFGLAHTAWAVVSMASLSYIWCCAIRPHRHRLLGAAVGFLSMEGLALVVGRGDCPVGTVPGSTR